MQKNKNQEKLPHVSANETFVLATDGKKNPATNITVPPDQDVEAARKFIEENEK